MCRNRTRYYNGGILQGFEHAKGLITFSLIMCTEKAQDNNPLTRVIKVFPPYLQNSGKINVAVDTEPGQN